MSNQLKKKKSKSLLQQKLHIKQSWLPTGDAKSKFNRILLQKPMHKDIDSFAIDAASALKTVTTELTELEANKDALRSTRYSTDCATKISSILRSRQR
jgi:hypothetical protein